MQTHQPKPPSLLELLSTADRPRPEPDMSATDMASLALRIKRGSSYRKRLADYTYTIHHEGGSLLHLTVSHVDTKACAAYYYSPNIKDVIAVMLGIYQTHQNALREL